MVGGWQWIVIPLPPLSPELAILGGTATAALLGLIVGSIAIRRQGIYFAMITLALAQMMFFFAVQAPFTHGEDGIQAVPRGRLFGLVDLSNQTNMYITVAVIFLASPLSAVVQDRIANPRSNDIRGLLTAEAVRGEEKRPRIPLEPIGKRSAGARAGAGNVDQRMSPSRVRTYAFQQRIRNAHPMRPRPAGSRRTNAIFGRNTQREDASALTWSRHPGIHSATLSARACFSWSEKESSSPWQRSPGCWNRRWSSPAPCAAPKSRSRAAPRRARGDRRRRSKPAGCPRTQ